MHYQSRKLIVGGADVPPLVSVVVPFYGVEAYLPDCLESLQAQTLGDFEVIMVDDGSTDGSAVIAAQFAQSDPRFRLLSQERRGPGPSRNYGIAAATGKYLMFVDSDDLVAPLALQQMVNSLESSGSDFVACAAWFWSLSRGLELMAPHRVPFAQNLCSTHISEIPLLMKDRTVWNKLWRRDLWLERGYEFPAMAFEDFPVSLRAHLEADRVDVLATPVYIWRERPTGDSISQASRKVSSLRDRVQAVRMVLDFVDPLGNHELRELVHSHFADVDLRESMKSLLIGLPKDQAELEQLVSTLAGYLDPDLIGLARPPFVKAHQLIEEGDFGQVREIARWWHGDRSPAAREAAENPAPPPDLLRQRVSAQLAKHSPLEVGKREATLADVTVKDGFIYLRLTFALNKYLRPIATAEIQIGSYLPEVRVSPLPTGIQLDVAVDSAKLIGLAGTNIPKLRVSAGPKVWTGSIAMEQEQRHGVRRGGYWFQGCTKNRVLAYVCHSRSHVVQRAHISSVGGERKLLLDIDTIATELTMRRPWPQEDLRIPIVAGRAELALGELENEIMSNPLADYTTIQLEILRQRQDSPWPIRDKLKLNSPTLVVYVGDEKVELKTWDDATPYLRISRAGSDEY